MRTHCHCLLSVAAIWLCASESFAQERAPLTTDPPKSFNSLLQATPIGVNPQEFDPHEMLKVKALREETKKPDTGAAAANNAAGNGAVADPMGITVAINQPFFIRPIGAKENLDKKQFSFDRPDILGYEGLSDKDRKFFSVRDKEARFSAVKLGTVRITYHDLDDTKPPQTFTVEVRPDVLYLNLLLKNRFPTAKINLVATGDNSVILDGVVENPGDSFAAENIMKLFKLGVINNLRLGGVMQVQLEVVIARVDRQELRRLGINNLLADARVGAGSTIGNVIGTPSFNLPNAARMASGAGAFNPIGSGAQALTPAANLFYGVTDSTRGWFAFIEAMRQNNAATILANPTLVAYNGRTADFVVGGKQPIPQAGALGVPSIKFETFGTRLTFLPTILGDGKLRIEVVPEVSSVDTTNSVTIGGVQVPSFVVQRLHTTVEMQHGQTLCMGGLLQTQLESQSEKVPLLGDAPGIGTFFRRVRHRSRETELLILVTPRLVDPMQPSQAPKQIIGQEFQAPTDEQLFFKGQLEVRRDACDPALPRIGDRVNESVAPGQRSSSFASERGNPVASPQIMTGFGPQAMRAPNPEPHVPTVVRAAPPDDPWSSQYLNILLRKPLGEEHRR